jgi:hypothetical protein
MIREMLKEELERTKLQEEVQGPGYIIKAWEKADLKDASNPTYDSAKKGVIYKDYEDVLTALKSSELDCLGAYEITWVQTGTKV